MESSKKVDLPEDVTKRIIENLSPDAFLKKFSQYGEGKYCLANSLYDPLGPGIQTMQMRPDDVWVASFPRSGTHWVSELVWLINNNLDYQRMATVPHAERMHFVELPDSYFDQPEKNLEVILNLPSPRFLKTHLPLSLLPPGLLDINKVVYIARDPRDVIVSYYNFPETKFVGGLKNFSKLFMDGHCMFTPYFGSVLEYWKQRNHPNLLFLFYEDMHKDLKAVARRVAKFFNRELSDGQIEELCSNLSFDNMKKNEKVYSFVDGLLRRGKRGGWREEFDEELTNDVNRWIDASLEGTDLKYSPE